MTAPGLGCSAVVRACSTGRPPASWPTVNVLALFPQPLPGATLANERSAARALARQVLAQHLGPQALAQWLQLRRAARGARNVSFSHEAGVSLLAWSATGAIGVDLVDLHGLARASQRELTATAALYLGPCAAAAVAAAAEASAAHMAFARHWSRLEARLKCLGSELTEWEPGTEPDLGRVADVPVHVTGSDGHTSSRWVGCLAWRALPTWASPGRLTPQSSTERSTEPCRESSPCNGAPLLPLPSP